MTTPDRGLRDKALNIINNVGQYGPLDATIDSYKQAADYADDARLYAEQALSGVTDLNTQIARVTALANEVETLTTEVNEAYTQVTTLDVDAVDGEAAAAVYNKEENKIHFTLPKGKDGVDGDDGKSSYQSYLDTTTDNPKLSEADWILSLKGKDGKDGTNGKDGVNGTNGTNGTNGYSAYELAVIDGYTGTLEDFNEMNTKSLDRNQNLSELTNVAAARTNLDVNSKAEVTSAINAASTSLQTNIDAKANKGANSDITSISGLTVALSLAQGGTGGKTAIDARTNLSVYSKTETDTNVAAKASKGANSDITSLTGLTTPLTLSQGGVGSGTAAGARTNLGLGTTATPAFAGLSITNPFAVNGFTDGSDAASGVVGEYLVITGTSISLTSGNVSNLTSLTLTAGDWDLEGTISFTSASGASMTQTIVGISTATNSFGSLGGYSRLNINYAAGSTNTALTPTVRISVSTSTPIYLNANASFSGGTTTSQGFLRARRVR